MSNTLWLPYTQMKGVGELPKMISGKGVMMHLEDGHSLIDGISSWWSVIHGYNHPALNAALVNQLESFAHVMLGGMVHEPAIALADKLVSITPAGLNHVFFSDSGSVGVEVALKMAIQYWGNKGDANKNRFVSLTNGYHGDTFKAMEVSDDSDFSRSFTGVLNRGFVVSPPKGGFNAAEVMVQVAVNQLEKVFALHHQEIAAFIVEPIVQCAGGFQLYSPLYLSKARELCNQYDVLLIFDEVATGFGRTGKLFAAEHAGVTPDMMVLGKGLTAGYMGHAATIATTEVYNSFLGEHYDKALMHGPTFMANALACTVALESIRLITTENYLKKINTINQLIQQEFLAIESTYIVEKRIIGAIGAIELTNAQLLNGFKQYAMDNGAWLRPIGNIVYVMPAYTISELELQSLIGVIRNWIANLP